MKKLHGPLNKIRMGDYTIYAVDGVLRVRSTGGVSRSRIMKDPSFANTRANMNEFAAVAKGNKLIRNAFRRELYDVSCKGAHRRLTHELVKVIKSDPVHARGCRQLRNGDFHSLYGFEFGDQYTIERIFHAHYETGIDAKEGRCWLHIPPFIPKEKISGEVKGNHFRLIAVAAEFSFEKETFTVSRKETALIPLDMNPTPDLHLNNTLTKDPEGAIFLAMGISFYDAYEGTPAFLNGGALRLIGACNE